MLDFQEHVFRKVKKMHRFWHSRVCFEDLYEDMFLKSKMKHVVKYCAHHHILLMVSIDVTTY